jgi:hypothetical protein
MPFVMMDTTDPVIANTAIDDPFGPCFSRALAAKADRLVVRGSSVGDPGGDYVEFELLVRTTAGESTIAKRRVLGY